MLRLQDLVLLVRLIMQEMVGLLALVISTGNFGLIWLMQALSRLL